MTAYSRREGVGWKKRFAHGVRARRFWPRFAVEFLCLALAHDELLTHNTLLKLRADFKICTVV
jgi:hypothetical protein